MLPETKIFNGMLCAKAAVESITITVVMDAVISVFFMPSAPLISGEKLKDSLKKLNLNRQESEQLVNELMCSAMSLFLQDARSYVHQIRACPLP